MRYVVTQRHSSPNTVVGSIEADSLGHAAAIARAMLRSFWVREWAYADPEERAEALRQDMCADERSLAERT